MSRSRLVSHLELTSYCCTHSHTSCQPLTLSSQDYSSQTRILPLTHTHTSLPTPNRSSSPTDYISQKYLWTFASAEPALFLLTISQFVLSWPSLVMSLISCFDLLYYNFPLTKKLSFQNMFSFLGPSGGYPLHTCSVCRLGCPPESLRNFFKT